MSDVGTNSGTAVQCLDVVRKYKLHAISRDQANTSIIKILLDDPKVPHDEETETGIPDFAIKHYFLMLDEFDTASKALHALSESRRVTTGTTLDDERHADEHEVEGRHGDGEDEQRMREGQSGDEYLPQREASPQPTSSSRKRADEQLYSWKSAAPSTVVDTNLVATLRLKSNYLRDLKGAKADLLSQLHCPRFPNSLWSDLLANKYIDFGKLLAHTNALKPAAQLLERIGDLEISTGAMSEPVTAIATMGQWTSAFAIYRKAVLFAYKHRTAELDSYYDHIIELFGSTRSSEHYRVINYDRSVRLLVGDSNALALDAHQEFTKQFLSHMLPYGVGAPGNEGSRQYSGGRVAARKSTPICKNWNWRSCAGCNYRHCCSRCQSFEHRVTQCPETVASSSVKEESTAGGRKPGFGGRQQAGPRA